MMRYGRLKDSDDLEQSILYFTEAIFLPLSCHRRSFNTIHILFFIASALIVRAQEFRHPEDVTRSIIYLRYLHEQSRQSPEVVGLPLNSVTGCLVHALGIQANMKLGDVRQDLEEMAILCHELLKSDTSMTSVTSPIMNLANVVIAQFQFGILNKQQEPSDKVIEFLRLARVLLPDSHDVSFALSLSLFARFRHGSDIAHSNDDYDEATTILDKVARIPGNNLTQIRVNALNLASTLAFARSIMFTRPEYREQAIHRSCTLLAELPPEHPSRSTLKSMLTQLHEHRSYGSRAATDIEALLKTLEVPDHPPFQDLTASLTEPNYDSEENLEKHSYALFSMNRITDEAEVEEAVKYCRLLLASSHHGSDFALIAGNTLTILLRRAFQCTNKIEYLNEEISVLRDKFNTEPEVQWWTEDFPQFKDLSHLYSSV